ncbi:major capsid protein [Paucibacter sp. APW11]|uniref:Major capsid protein n=1 Tax=Roseateles aquae TaxID=3077235 RepID=A0ABU3P5B8_9BURK|nr:major capsid protein [Paucibacter sp. APW11]MDT8997771.1 major capsid protein [Paucibacter sp. APW11]
MNKKFLKRAAVVAIGLATAAAAHADAIDLTGPLADIKSAAAAVATIGGAVFTVHIGIKVWKWITRSA